jgi:histidyl-tRNA synthetase
VVVAGEDEIKEGKLTLKKLASSEQEKLTFEELISKVKG